MKFKGLYCISVKMKLVFVFALVASLFAEYFALPVGKERQREVLVTRCLVEVLSKALSNPDSQPLDEECKDILKTSSKHSPLEKRSDEEVLTAEEELPKGDEADVKDIEALLKSVEERRGIPEASWGLEDEEEKGHKEEGEGGKKEKRIWKPTHRYHHKKHYKRDEAASEEVGEPDESRSQESWDLDDEREKRSAEDEEDEEREKRIWKPTHRYHHKKHHKRSEDPAEVEGEENEDREKRIWKPTHRYHHKKHHKRNEGPSEEEADDERSQELWGLDEDQEKRSLGSDDREKRGTPRRTVHSRRYYKRDEEPLEETREEPYESRSQESWGLDEDQEKRSLGSDDREKRGKPRRFFHSRRYYKRDEEPLEDMRQEPDESRSQESWGLDEDMEKRSLGSDDREKRGTPRRTVHSRRYYKRSGGSAEREEEEERRSDSGEDEEEEHNHADGEMERNREEAVRYLEEKRSEMERQMLGEGEVSKRSPWAYRGYYHPAWWKRTTVGHTASSHKENELENLAAMDMELQRIVEKLHDNRND